MSDGLSATKTKNIDDIVNIYLPKYLFMKKQVFKEILKKNDLKKIGNANKLVQKTENLMRKNSNLHKEIVERFLLNLSKIIG